MTTIPNDPFVFLGGSCEPTTWRANIAIPILKDYDISYYNPQKDRRTPELPSLECKAKDFAKVWLFVIDKQTRAIASMLEVTEGILTGRLIVLTVEDIKDGTVMGDRIVTDLELRDLNSGRAYLRELAVKNGVSVYDTIPAALAEVTYLFGDPRQTNLLRPQSS